VAADTDRRRCIQQAVEHRVDLASRNADIAQQVVAQSRQLGDGLAALLPAAEPLIQGGHGTDDRIDQLVGQGADVGTEQAALGSGQGVQGVGVHNILRSFKNFYGD
jgi:hypothetical protein